MQARGKGNTFIFPSVAEGAKIKNKYINNNEKTFKNSNKLPIGAGNLFICKRPDND